MKHKYLKIFTFLLACIFFFTHSVAPVLATVQYLYDSNGNMSSDGEKCYTYNDENQLTQVKNCSNNQLIAEYAYDYKGTRIKKKEYNNGTLQKTTYTPTKSYETVKLSNNTTQNTSYYYANSQIIARKNPDGSKTYYQNDHLSSTNLLTNQNGDVVENTTYYPYGEVKSGGTQSKYLYTGKQKDAETGLSYYEARYYNPHIGRFAQPDKLLADVYDPQQLNRYAYVRNNPLKYTDPSGNFIFLAAIPLTAWLVGAALATAAVYFSTPMGKETTKTVATTIVNGLHTAAQVITNAGKTIINSNNNNKQSPQTNSQPTNSKPPTGGNPTGNTPKSPNPFNNIKDIATIATGTNVVYQAAVNGQKYFGITNDFFRRLGEHGARFTSMNIIPGLDKLSRFDARAVEQVLIERDRLPNLINKINSISPNNPVYQEAIKRGNELLNMVGM
jgi:RHS repeat-associated protein